MTKKVQIANRKKALLRQERLLSKSKSSYAKIQLMEIAHELDSITEKRWIGKNPRIDFRCIG